MKSIGYRSLFTVTLSTCVVFSVAACSGDDDLGTTLGSGGAVSTGGAQTGSGGAVSGSGGSSNSGGSSTSGTGGAVGAGGSQVGAGGGDDGAGGSVDGAGGSGDGAGGGDGGDGDVVQSKGCGVVGGATMLTAGSQAVDKALSTSRRINIQSGGKARNYIIDIPADYDANKPYRLIFSWNQAYGSNTGNANGLYPANPGPNFDAQNYAFFGLHRAAAEAGDSAIFIAPAGDEGLPWNYDRDVLFFDELLKIATDNLCIDENRVFTTGFSFGAMMSYALSVGRASKLRGAVTMAAANWSFTQPPSDGGSVAYFGITGMSDGTCNWVRNDGAKEGGKYCVLQHAEDNGCTGPANIATAMVGSKNHVCVDMEGCDEGLPVKVCTFDGAHTPSSVSDGSNGGDDGKEAFVPPLAWEFISAL